MSKTTAMLFIVLIVFIGLLAAVLFEYRQNPLITSLTKPLITVSSPPDTTLSFTSDNKSLQRGQTVAVGVLIQNTNPHPSIVQLEMAYDPTVVTIDSITPGTFFTNPVIALQNIDPVAGRISYALRCPTKQTSVIDCVNTTSPTVATITLSINPYAASASTSLSFLPKSLIRSQSGKDLLKKTNDLAFAITSPLLPIASSSAIASPGANLIRTQPIH